MSNFKTMKIKVNDTNRELVRRALVDVGYEPKGKMLDKEIYSRADGYYTYEGDMVFCSTGDVKDYFECHENPEHWLQNGAFVDSSYWTQPATETTYEPLPAPPLGLKPRKLYNEARIIDILEAMTRYVEAGKPIDQDWLDELNRLIMENQ